MYFLISVLSGAPIQVEKMPDSAKIEWEVRERERESLYLIGEEIRAQRANHVTAIATVLQGERERERRRVGWGWLGSGLNAFKIELNGVLIFSIIVLPSACNKRMEK